LALVRAVTGQFVADYSRPVPTDHDAIAHVDRLRQALESSRRPIALFLSAGCPMAVEDEHGNKPLIPDVTGMTEDLTKRLEGSDVAEAFGKLGKVLAEDGKANADLEYMLSLVRALRDVAGAAGARGLSLDELQRLDDAISGEVAELARPLLPKLGTPYHDAMRWVGGAVRDDPVEVFTTNYDLLSEQALEEAGVPYFDGFVGAHEPFFDVRAIEDDVLPPRWARLWKLHGSINWCLSERRSVVRKPTHEGIARRLIHPSHLKYDESRRMPYLALHDRLRSALRRPHFVMVTCGYSFRDEHLNEVLREGLERNASAVVFGLLHGEIAKYPAAASVAERAANLLLLARDGAIVGSVRGPWRPVDDPDAVVDTPGVSLDGDQPSFQLGDFAHLAALLRELAGAAP
jgi:hypothetical protein